MRSAILVLVPGLAYPSANTRADDLPKRWDFIGRTEAAADVRARVMGHVARRGTMRWASGL